jgi:hypothetical protein
MRLQLVTQAGVDIHECDLPRRKIWLTLGSNASGSDNAREAQTLLLSCRPRYVTVA